MKKAPPPNSAVAERDHDAELPEGWASARLQDVADLVSGAGFPLERQGRVGLKYPFFKVGTLAHVDSSEFLIKAPDTIDEPTARSLGAKIIPAGSVLFAKIGMAIRLNRRRLAGLPCCIDNNLMAAIPDGAVLPRYLLRLLETVPLMELTTATTVPSLRKSDLDQLPIALPPLNEQERIIAKVEELLKQRHNVGARLENSSKILKAFRQSVLAAACSGRLTEDWRGKHCNGDSGDSLLGSILEQRRQVWEERQKLNLTRDQLQSNSWKQRYKQPISAVSDELDDLPNTWVWASVDALSTKVVDGVHKTPEYVPKGVPFVTVRNLTAGPGISFDDLNYVTQEDHDKFIERANPESGDILVSKDGTLGVIRAIRTEKVFSIFVSVAMIKPVSRELTDYLELALSSPSVQKQMVGTGSGLQHIHLRDLRADCIPLPPLEEQQEIVRRVEALFKLADKIEERVAAATKRADKLTQAILAKAFRGELVPTEAELARKEGRDYEPASALLERIKSEREQSAASPNGTKRRKVFATKK